MVFNFHKSSRDYMYSELLRQEPHSEPSLFSSLGTRFGSSISWRYRKDFLLWLIIHITHWALYFGNLSALFFVVAFTPWYIALPVLTVMGNPIVGGIYCAYNNIENVYREKLGFRLIHNNFLNAVVEDIQYLRTKYNGRT